VALIFAASVALESVIAATTPNFDLVGFAALNALGQNGTTGGASGPRVQVSTLTDFVRYAQTNVPLRIELLNDIDCSSLSNASAGFPANYPVGEILVNSNKTIYSRNSSTIRRGSLRIGKGPNGKHNIIIRNLKFRDMWVLDPTGQYDTYGWDYISIESGSHHIWVDHCDFEQVYDGMVDIKTGSDFVTVSWNIFRTQKKGNLVGHSDNYIDDRGHLNVTFHHNWYDRVDERMPRMRFGNAHVFNLYCNDLAGKGIQSTTEAATLVENVYFFHPRAGSFPTVEANGGPTGTVKVVNSRIVNLPGVNVSFREYGASNFTFHAPFAGATPPYNYTLDPVDDVPGIVTNYAGTGKIDFLLGQGPSTVTLNSNNVLVINGRTVFPITLSPGPPTNGRTASGDDALQELHDAGAQIFRMAQTTDWDSQVISNQQAALDWAAQHDMYCMVNLRELSEFPLGDTNTESALRDIMRQFKDHPALAIWKNQDEAWWGGVSADNLRRGYDVIKQEDTNHPIEQTHAPRGTVADLQPYNVAADILALDIYPVSIPPGTHSLLPNKEISMVGDWTQFLAQVANGQEQYWMIEQIAWSGVTPPKPLVFPTFRQSRFMAYQAIVNGARGLMFFGGNVASVLNAQDAPLGWNWSFWNDVLGPVVREIGDHSPLASALVAPDSSAPITITGVTVPDLEFRVREAPPYLYILASKREGATATVTFSGLPAWAAAGEVLYESRVVTVANGQFTDTFAPFDVHVYRFSQTSQSPTVLFPPQSRANYPGTPASFYVFADGTGPLAYQWRKDGINLSNDTNVSGATSPNLNLASVSASSVGNYDVVITGFGSITSASANLLIIDYDTNQVPAIVSQPLSRTNFAGTVATFSVVANGNGPFAWQWRRNGTNLFSGGNVSDATLWTLTLSNVSPADAATYDVLVSGFTTVTSAPATLTVITNAPGALLLYEPFDYPNIGGPVSSNTPANWTFGGSGANDLSVVSGNLSWPGLTQSAGNSVTNGGVGLGVRRLLGTNINSGVLYFSALFRINGLGYGAWNGAASIVSSLTAPDNTSFRLSIVVRSNSPSGYLIGAQKGGTGATAGFDTTERRAGDTVFLVGKYDFTTSPNSISLWINPPVTTYGSISEPSSGFLSANSGVDGFTIDRFNIRQNTAASVPAAMQWDELRVGTTWAAVTPHYAPSLTILSLTNGLFRFAYTENAGRSYTIYASTDLIDWIPLGAATETSPGRYEFTDTATSQQRFYRLRFP